MKIKPLPPLNSLVAFEASARHLSFTQAANELNVTQGAISRQVKQLEDYLGKEIFTRSNRFISLTPAGHQYYQVINNSLLDISQITSEVKEWKGDQKITIATTNAMASLWLLPKFAKFQREYGNVDLQILVSDEFLDIQQTECDLAFIFCRTPPLNMKVTKLFWEEIFPVCSPDYLNKIGTLKKIDSILDTTILYLDESQKDWVNWEEWCSEVSLPNITPCNKVRINNYSMLLQAAIAGQGVALAWGGLVDNHLKSGELVKPTDFVLSTKSFFAMLEPNRRAIPAAIKCFREWLLNELPTITEQN